MELFFSLNSLQIRYKIVGKGPAILFFHGYLETLEIWDDFINGIKSNFTAISFDIPGHGKSGEIAKIHKMSKMAELANCLIEYLNIDKCSIIAHSMGGYIALEFAKLFPNKTMSICLFHSNPFPDSDEKKENRHREISLINNGKKDIIFNTNISRAFADGNIKRFNDIIEKIKSTAFLHSESGIIALLKGMIRRNDNTVFLKNINIPTLLIFGKHDNYFSIEKVLKIEHSECSSIVVLLHSGHMGFIEEKECTIDITKTFYKKNRIL